jgi:hypothetical protein
LESLVQYLAVCTSFTELGDEIRNINFQMRDGELFIIALPDLPDGYDVSLESVLKLIHARRNRHSYISYENGSYFLNDKKNISKKELAVLLMKYAPVSVIRAALPGYVKTDPGERYDQLELYVINEYGGYPDDRTGLHAEKERDLPEDYGTEPEDIFRLVKEKDDLALKMVSGSHRDGFYRFSYKDGEYLLNGDPTSEEEIEGIIMNPDSQYLITEFIKSHPELSKYYDGAVSTLRFIVFKKDGRTPQMADCYMSVGTSANGAIDNIGAGGMFFVKVDMKDGHYSDAALMVNNNIIPTPYHPDSGLLVEGYIPIMQKAGMLPVYSFS